MRLNLDVWVLQQYAFIWSLLVARCIYQALRENYFMSMI